MSKVINYNELRKLAVKAGKSRPVLSCIKIQDGKAYFTNSWYLVVMEGYKGCEDSLTFMDNYKRSTMDYPNLDPIINQRFETVEFEKTILDDKVVYKVGECCVDDEILTQIKKLVAIKNFTVDVNSLKVKGHVAKLVLPDESMIIFTLKRYRKDE